MQVDYKEIGQNIKLCRTRNRLKQRELAEMVDVTEQHISHIECGRTTPGLSVLIRLSEVLSVSLYVLLGSNVRTQADEIVDGELNSLFKNSTQAQRTLCMQLCRNVLEYDIHFD